VSFESVNFEVDAAVAHLTLNRPDRGNAFDTTLCAELSEVAIECDESDAVRCLLVEAEGKWFSTGGDLARLGASRAVAPAFVKAATTPLHSALSRLARMSAPVAVALEAWDSSLETQLEREARALARATRTDDGWHGISAALAGDQPTFTGH
jgi:2-(1,2-epoxy-1,2-dihydrophenyl)acetyl-CoA isomerase